MGAAAAATQDLAIDRQAGSVPDGSRHGAGPAPRTQHVAGGFTSPCPSAMQMLRTSRGREKLLFTIGDNGLQPRGLHRSSIGHPDIAAGNVPGVPFHHMAAALALT